LPTSFNKKRLEIKNAKKRKNVTKIKKNVKNVFYIYATNLPAGEHVRDVIGNCTQSLHAVKLLRRHGMSANSLRHVYKAVVVSELLYASPAWWPGFTSAADKQRLEASVRRGTEVSPGFGVRGAGHDERGAEGASIEAPKGAKWGGYVWGVVSAPQPTRGSGGAS